MDWKFDEPQKQHFLLYYYYFIFSFKRSTLVVPTHPNVAVVSLSKKQNDRYILQKKKFSCDEDSSECGG